jgi:hypothetical protein
LAELEERGFGWDLGYRPSSLGEFLLAPIHPPSGRLLGPSEASTPLGNLVNLAHLNTTIFHANWILDSGASKHVTGHQASLNHILLLLPHEKKVFKQQMELHNLLRVWAQSNALH